MRTRHRILRTEQNKPVQKKEKSITFKWSQKHIDYIRKCQYCTYNIAEGAVRAGKTVDNVYAFAHEMKSHPDKLFLATGATAANAKLNIGECNGMGLKYIFRGQCRDGKFEGNDCLIISGPSTSFREKIVIFAGGAKANSFQKIRGNSYGMWIATEINQHHDSMIKECFNRIVASLKRKIFWDLNPDHPRAPIYTDYIDSYVERDKTGELLGGVNYDKFTIYDNINISDERRAEVISQYEEGSIWYNRDILGMRSIAQGLVYKGLASELSLPPNQKKPHSLTIQEANQLRFEKIVVSIDFGGNGSGHALVAVGITADQRYKQKLVALKSRRYKEGEVDPDTGQIIRDIEPDDLEDIFVNFCREVERQFSGITVTYGDSAETVLIRGLKSAMSNAGMGHIKPKGAYKREINERIFALCALYAQGRFCFVEEECKSLMDALSQAVWDPKQPTANVRLDNGTSDIDSLDAFEYGYERDIEKLISKN